MALQAENYSNLDNDILVDSDYFQIFPFITVYFRYKYINIYNVLRISLQSE